MLNLDENFSYVRKKIEPLIIPYIQKYIEPPKNIIDLSAKNDSFNEIKKLSNNCLLISESSLPEVDKFISIVCDKLDLDRKLVSAFVFPAMEISAFAISNKTPITIALSAGSIQRLSSEELFFVIGHEIGHALIGSLIKFDYNSNTLEDLIFARGLEISADRIGLLATNNVESAHKAILKLLTGLDDKLLKNSNIKKILDENQVNITEEDSYSSHPPLLIRIQALYHLSISKFYHDLIGSKGGSDIDLNTINDQTTEFLKQSVDQVALLQINEKLNDMSLWPISLLIFNQIKVDLNDLSKKLNIELDKETIQKAFNFINSYSGSQKVMIMHEKITTTMRALNKVAPRKLKEFHDGYSKLFPTIMYTDIEYLKSILI